MADLGFQVTCVDNDQDKIRALEGGQVPIYEPGLDQILRRNVREKRLHFTMDGKAAIQAAEVIYIAVGTPSAPDGSADLSGVLAVAMQIGDNLRRSATVIIKSTVPVGTADQVRELIASRTTQEFDVVSNPEFLKEGAAVEDFMRPDRIVIGCKAPRSRTVMEQLYASLVRTGRPILFMDNRSAELTKYASNALLATKISFMNELSRLCEKTGADVELVR
jgi:UDPglucose 6-dehydrogenase